jgi:hypothetical protein
MRRQLRMPRVGVTLLLTGVLSACEPGTDASDALLVDLTLPRARQCGHCG